jgi:hypothetical protein
MGGGETGTGFDAPPVAYGKITGFGSVYVNGVKFNTTNGRVLINGVQTPESSLRVGMIVTVRGSINSDRVTGVAQEIDYENEIKGLVNSVTPANTGGNITLNVMGQTVVVDASTIIEGVPAASGIAQNKHIEVSGYTSSDGIIYASYLEVKDSDGSAELKGTVGQLSADGKTFKLGDTTVRVSTTTRFEDIVSLSNNLYVEAKGSYDAQQNILDATSIELKSKTVVDASKFEGNEIKIDGQITATPVAASGEIEVNGQVISIVSSTEGTTSGFQLGQQVFVEAVMSGGKLVAKEIKTRESGSSGDENEIESTITSVDTTNASINVQGVNYFLDTRTVMKDELSDDRNFNIASLDRLKAGDNVELRFYQDTSGKYILTELKRLKPEENDEDSDKGSTTETGDSSSGDESKSTPDEDNGQNDSD